MDQAIPRLEAPRTPEEMKTWLDEVADYYNHSGFLALDPIAIPHQFRLKEDIEIAGFLTATLAWGQRVTVLNSARKLMAAMDHSPYSYILESSPRDWQALAGFVHRTFNGTDCMYFLWALQHIYQNLGGLEQVFANAVNPSDIDISNGLIALRRAFFWQGSHARRTEKHFSDITTGAAAKRLNMYLRWMVRRDGRGVDFGLWQTIRPAQLLMPLDVHTGRVARALGLLSRKANDWRAVQELTKTLRQFDPEDPVKYDLALFGLGASGVMRGL